RQNRSSIRRESNIQAKLCRAGEFPSEHARQVHLLLSGRGSSSHPEFARRAQRGNRRNDPPHCARPAVSGVDRTPGNPASDNEVSRLSSFSAKIHLLETARIQT